MDAATYGYYEAMMARTIQMEEYFTTGQISTNFFNLMEEVSEVLQIMEMEQLISDPNAFYIMGTPTIH
jgi:hypothetical protein